MRYTSYVIYCKCDLVQKTVSHMICLNSPLGLCIYTIFGVEGFFSVVDIIHIIPLCWLFCFSFFFSCTINLRSFHFICRDARDSENLHAEKERKRRKERRKEKKKVKEKRKKIKRKKKKEKELEEKEEERKER